jgi:hypothetical protein
MKTHFVLPRLALALAVLAVACGPSSGLAQQAATPTMQSTSADGVTMKVTPKGVAPGAAEWEFTVVLDTHSRELDDDLAKSSVLVADGIELRPIGWSGAPPGGHHREGVLRFAAPTAPVQVVELRIQRSGESSARVFRWDGANWR